MRICVSTVTYLFLGVIQYHIVAVELTSSLIFRQINKDVFISNSTYSRSTLRIFDDRSSMKVIDVAVAFGVTAIISTKSKDTIWTCVLDNYNTLYLIVTPTFQFIRFILASRESSLWSVNLGTRESEKVDSWAVFILANIYGRLERKVRTVCWCWTTGRVLFIWKVVHPHANNHIPLANRT